MSAKQSGRQPTELELLILKVLWNAHDDGRLPMAVRDIRDDLAEMNRDLAHTSVITTLNIMVDKRFLKRSKRKNAFFFTPRIERDDVQSRAIGDVLNRIFDGSAQSLMLSLLDRSELNAEDLAEIQKLLKKHASKNSSQ